MSRAMELKIKYLVDGLRPIDQAHQGELFDLRAAEDVELDAGEYKKIRLGIAMELPDGYEAHIYPRSSTFEKWGIIMTNSVGIIDNSYSGPNDEWQCPVFALRRTKIHKNDRICQMRLIYQQPEVNVRVVHELSNPDRGGFGSTGTN